MSRAESAPDGVLLIGHGTTDAAGMAEIETLTRLVTERLPALAVETCFLEHAGPTIAEGFARLAARGARRIAVVPLLLFAAGHARRDIPFAVERAREAHPACELLLAPHLGCHDRLIELSALRCDEIAGGDAAPATPAETLLVLVGRGSYEPDANAEMAAFARWRFERRPVGWYEVCFLSMAEPRVERTFDLVAGLPFGRIVVQPHLLFRGALLERLRGTIEARSSRGEQHWLMTEHLGPHPLLVEAIVDRAGLAPRP
ncbi:MAG: sirohydrochlorin chelatase [Pirellulales bacterium]|nr:sirohydrochlorin chelatase [Pirellulales bacterium]